MTVDRSTPAGPALAEADDPRPRPDEALVRVVAASVNPADLHAVAVGAAGDVPGAEAAGVVEVAAADGSGPRPGTAVLTLGLGGAEVVAGARRSASTEHLRDLGADEVVLDGPAYAIAPVSGVVETVGGAHLPGAFARLLGNGTLVSVGRASGEPASFPADALRGDGGAHGRSLVTFFLADGTPGLGADRTWLAERLADGRLRAEVDARLPWTAAIAADGPLATGTGGKLVLDVR